MNFEDTLDRLYDLEERSSLSDGELNYIYALSQSDDDEIRSQVAALLIRSNKDKSREALLKMCNDNDELVRANACESLCIFYDDEVISSLKEKIVNDTSSIVKSYAVLSLGDIALHLDRERKEDITKFLLCLVDESSNKSVQISAYRGLYLLGNKKYIDDLLEALNSTEYTDRHHAIRSLCEVINQDNRKDILRSFRERKDCETVLSVLTLLNKVIETEGVL